MSDLRIKRRVSAVPRGNADGFPIELRGTRDGAMFTAPWLTALSLEGRCFGINTATGTSPDTFTTDYTATKPDAYIAVPPGTTIIPVFIEVVNEDTDAAGVVDCMAVASNGQDTSGGGTAVTIYNMRTDAPIKSNCTASATLTTGTTPLAGNFVEFWRGTAGMVEDGFNGATAQTSELNSRTAWNAGKALVPPVIIGAGSLSVFASNDVGATAVKGWITVIWAEVPSNSIV